MAAVLFAVAGAAVLLAVFALLNLADETADSPDSFYIEVGAMWIAVAAVAAAVGAWALRAR